MRLILTETVYQLITMAMKNPIPARVFLEPVYLKPDGDERSWAILRDESGERAGIALRYDQFTIWCAEENQEYLHNKVLLKDPQKGFIAVPAILLDG